MSSIETRPWAQPHVFSVPPYSFQITSMCQREVGGGEKLWGAEEKEEEGEPAERRSGAIEKRPERVWWRSAAVLDGGTDLCDSHL